MIRLAPVLAVIAVLGLMPGPVVAQQETELCLRVEVTGDVDLSDRSAVQEGVTTGEILVTDVLDCDAVASPAPESQAPDSDVGTGAWVVGPIEVDPATGDRRASASLAAAEGTVWWGEPYTLTITCSLGIIDVAVTWLWELGPERLVDVETKIGDDQSTTEPWFNDGQSTSYGRDDEEFIQSLLGETLLSQQVALPQQVAVPQGGMAAVAVFDISGIENAVANVREACGS
jgi:hypothetical protein